MEGNELIVVENLNPVKLFFETGLDEILKGIRTKIDAFEGDISSEKGRKEIVSMAYKVSRSKTLLDTMRKELISDAKKKIDKANGIWKPARETLDEWRDEIRQPVTDWEEAKAAEEQKRIANVQSLMQQLENLRIVDPRLLSAEQIQEAIKQIESFEVAPEFFFEFTAEANTLKSEVLVTTCKSLELREQLDAEEEKRREEEARLAEERKRQEVEAAKLKAEQEKLEAEKRKIREEKEALERAEFERKAKEEARIQAEKDAKEKAEREERDRIALEHAKEAKEAREEALKPDKQKLREWIRSFNTTNNPPPDVSSTEGKALVEQILHKLEIFLQGYETSIDQL